MLDSRAQISESGNIAVVRAAEAMIRVLGGCSVTVLFPVSTANEQSKPGLGLGEQLTEQVELSPAAMLTLPRDSGLAATRLELLVPASTIFTTMAERVAATPENLFDSALGVIHEGRLLRIESWTAEYFSGTPYLFRVTVQG